MRAKPRHIQDPGRRRSPGFFSRRARIPKSGEIIGTAIPTAWGRLSSMGSTLVEVQNKKILAAPWSGGLGDAQAMMEHPMSAAGSSRTLQLDLRASAPGAGRKIPYIHSQQRMLGSLAIRNQPDAKSISR